MLGGKNLFGQLGLQGPGTSELLRVLSLGMISEVVTGGFVFLFAFWYN